MIMKQYKTREEILWDINKMPLPKPPPKNKLGRVESTIKYDHWVNGLYFPYGCRLDKRTDGWTKNGD